MCSGSHLCFSPQLVVLVPSSLPDSGAVGRHRTGLHCTAATGRECLVRRGEREREEEGGKDIIK